MKTVLITGGMGFIGSSLCKHFLYHGDRVIAVDNLSTAVCRPSDSELSDFENFEFHQMDLTSPNLAGFEELLKKADLVYHLAGSVGVAYIDKDPKSAIRNNYIMNAVLFPIFERHGKKVVFASTSEVYGDRKDAREDESLTIGSPDVLRWGYACGKLMSEFLLRSMSFPYVVARFFNVTGKGQSGAQGMVAAKFVEHARKGLALTVFDKGDQVRSFCDIRDAVAMLAVLGEDDRTNGEIFNVGNEKNACSIKELAFKVQERSPLKVDVVFRPFEETFSKMTKDIHYRTPSMKKMAPYYQCHYSLEDILDSMLETR